ncbi:MAG TPA: myxococcus cysteine-rich repeat containing protein, partial [Polyangiaceae bacterium]|nr:myxococcus cysteine-rich repeat containing protein [Polyangiaceae bacterium]
MNETLEILGRIAISATLLTCAACSSDSGPEEQDVTKAGGDVLSLAADDVLRINFQDRATTPPVGYLKDFGEPFGLRSGQNQGGLSYGWVAPGTHTPLNLSVGGSIPGNGRNRGKPADVRRATLMHMQASDLPSSFNGTHEAGAWEVAIQSGRYRVLVVAGDASYFNSVHGIGIEGVAALQNFTPSPATPFRQVEVVVRVDDGALTIEPTGMNTKINCLEVRLAATVCGNRAVEPGEACDDGNTTNGDGCSSSCQIEAASETRPGLDTRPDAPAYLGLPSSPELSNASWTAVPAFPNATFTHATAFQEAPGTGHAVVLEREGRAFAIDLGSATAARKPVLDLSAVSQGKQDVGLVGIAFHPQFGQRSSPNGRFMYLFYPYSPNPVTTAPVPATFPTEARLSRFTVNLDTMLADPASELVLISQKDDSIWHQGGAMFFHP